MTTRASDGRISKFATLVLVSSPFGVVVAIWLAWRSSTNLAKLSLSRLDDGQPLVGLPAAAIEKQLG